MQTVQTILKNLAISLSSLVVTLIFLEIAVRIVGAVDASGQFFFLERRILPYQLQTEMYRESIERYLETPADALLLYDEQTGWILNPNREDVNTYGMRNLFEPAQTPADDVIRIALFGDSFTEGADVEIDETWAHILNQCLTERGYNVEILNFGVRAYGIDQAYLLYQASGVSFEPDIVLFGFHPSDIHRNMTAFRPLVGGTLAFSKPRFILQDGDLTLLNQPAIPPEDLIPIYEDFEAHPFFQYEILYDERYQEAWWANSRVLSLVAYATSTERSKPFHEFYVKGSEFTVLTDAIVREFGASVTANGAEFVVVHLPGRDHLAHLEENDSITYFSLLDDFSQEYPIIYPETGLQATNDAHWTTGFHYSAIGNEIMGNNICDTLINDGIIVD